MARWQTLVSAFRLCEWGLISSKSHPTEDCSLLPNAVFKDPTSLIGSQIWLTSLQTIRFGQLPFPSQSFRLWHTTSHSIRGRLLHSRQYLVLCFHSVCHHPCSYQMSPTIDSKPRSTASPAPNPSKAHIVPTPAAPTPVKTHRSTVRSPAGYRPYACSHCKRAF